MRYPSRPMPAVVRASAATLRSKAIKPPSRRSSGISSSIDLEAMQAEITAKVEASPLENVLIRLADNGDRVIYNDWWGTLTEDSVFQLASSSKLFTGMTALHCISQGHMSYTDTLSSILPEFAGTPVANATISQIMCHTSGIQALDPTSNPTTGTLYTWVQRIAAGEFSNLLAPGVFNYSGTGFDVLNRVTEKVWWDAEGELLEDLLKRLYTSIGCTSTVTATFPDPESIPPEDLAIGRGRYLAGGGGLRSTGRDMVRFMGWMRSGAGILSPQVYQDMIKFRVQNPAFDGSPYTAGEYGYCLYRERVSAKEAEPPLTIGHGGSLGTIPYVDLRTGVHGIIVGPTSLANLFALGLDVQTIVRKYYKDLDDAE